MTVTAAVIENYDDGQTTNYFVMWSGARLVASCPIVIEAAQPGYVAISVSPDGRYACCSDGLKTVALEAGTSAATYLPFTLHGFDYAPFNTGYVFGPRFHLDGYIYDADFSRRAKVGIWEIEELSPLPNIQTPSFVEYDLSANRIWVSYSRPVQFGALIKCFDLRSRTEVPLTGPLAIYAGGSTDLEYYGRVMASPDGQYLHVYFRENVPGGGDRTYARKIFSVRGEKTFYLPRGEFSIASDNRESLFSGYVFGRGKFAYYQWREDDSPPHEFEMKSALLDLNDDTTVVRSFGLTTGNLSIPGAPPNHHLVDGQSFAVMGGYYKWNERNARGVSLATGDIVAAPECFNTEYFPSGATYSFITAIASQPRYWDAPRDGVFWTKQIYTAEIA